MLVRQTSGIFTVSEVCAESQKVIVKVNGVPVLDDEIRTGENIKFYFEIPISKMITIELVAPDATLPFENGVSQDDELLSFAVDCFTMQQSVFIGILDKSKSGRVKRRKVYESGMDKQWIYLQRFVCTIRF